MLLANVKQKLIRAYGGFDQNEYGFVKFKALIEAGAQAGYFALNTAGLEGAVIVANVRRQQQVEKNNRIRYNVMSAQYQDMVLAGIIDPAKVTRGALENTASIAAMILTIEVLVADTPGG